MTDALIRWFFIIKRLFDEHSKANSIYFIREHRLDMKK